jgi:hypothetical protein
MALDCPFAVLPGTHEADEDIDGGVACSTCGDHCKADEYEAILFAQLMREWRAQPIDPAVLGEGTYRLADLLDDPELTAPPRVVAPRLAWAGRVVLLHAREKDGKSTLATAAAAAVSAGADFLDREAGPGRVVWAKLEEHRDDLVTRLLRFGANPERLVVFEGSLKKLEALVHDIKPELVVVDTLAALADGFFEKSLDPGNSAAWTKLMRPLSKLAQSTGAALLLIHHSRKRDGEYRDSSAIGANVDVTLKMLPDDKDEAVRRLTAKGRFSVESFGVRLVGDGYELVDGPEPLRDRILNFVRSNPGCSKRKLRDGVTGRNGDKDSVLRELLDSGEIENRGNSTALKLYVRDTA